MKKLLYKFSAAFFKMHRFFFEKAKLMERHNLPLSELNKEKWYSDGKEKELRYTYELDENSCVLDVGGYEGDFAAEIFARYKSKVYVFEPVKKYITYLEKRFKFNKSVVIIPKGLGATNSNLQISVMDEASSYNRSESIHKKGTQEQIEIMDVADFCSSYGVTKIALIKINIEGAEYDLLDRMIDLGLVNNCNNLQIQFHDFYPDYENRYKKIKDSLEKTHRLTYSYPFVWENWRLK